ncbi:MAG: ABC transporter permease [Clostridiales bacterium]|nr:ABC transporter permease [Clostridiales bacterium]
MWWKNIRIRKLQTVVMFLIVLLCSTLLMASFGIITSLSKPFDEFIEECQVPATHFFPYTNDEEELQSIKKRFEALDEVENVEEIKRHYIEEKMYSGNKQVQAFMDLVEIKDQIHDHIHFFEGDLDTLKSMKEDECAIPSCIANEQKIKVGDTVSIDFPKQAMTYTVKVIYSSPYDSMSAYNSSILVKHLPTELETKAVLYIYTKDGVSPSELESAYRKSNGGLFEGAQTTITDMKDANQLLGAITGSIFLVIGVIMLLVSGLIINFMIRSMMVADAKTIAVYKTLGYESHDILMMYLKFYFVIVSIACVSGIGIGYLLKNKILANMFANIGCTGRQSIFVIGIPCFIGIVSFVLLVIYLLVRKTRDVKPVIALNGMSHSNTKRKKYKGNSSMQFSSLGIAIRTIRSDKKGMIGIMIISIMTTFIINFAVISLDIAYDLRNDNNYWIGIDKCDVMITVTDPSNLEKVKSNLDQDTNITKYLLSTPDFPLTLDWKEGMKNTFMYTFVYDDYEETNIPIVLGKNPATSNEIAISSVMAEQCHKTVGDYITVYLNGQDRVELLITGIFQTYYNMGQAARITSEVLEGHDMTLDYHTISIYLKDGVDSKGYITSLQTKLDTIGKVYPRTESFGSIMNMVEEPQKIAIPYVIALVFLIGGANIFSVVLLRNAKNEKMNGIYKSIGYTSGHLTKANIYYIIMLTAISMAVAIPVLLFVYPTIMKLALTMFNFIQYPVHYNVLHLVIMNITIFLVFIIFTYCSSLSIKKVSVRKLVNE